MMSKMLRPLRRRLLECHRQSGHKHATTTLALSLMLAPLAMVCTLPADAAAQTGTYQSLASIRASAEAYVREHQPWQDYPTEISSTTLDSRLLLPDCGQPLDAAMATGSTIRQRSTVLVSCNSAAATWKIYVPVTTHAYADVLVMARAVASNARLSAADVKPLRQDIASLDEGYISRIDEVDGLRTRLSLSQGTILTPSNTQADAVIQRGQLIKIQGGSGTVVVSMNGVALADAGLGARVQARNSQSGKIVEGVVSAPGVVEIP